MSIELQYIQVPGLCMYRAMRNGNCITRITAAFMYIQLITVLTKSPDPCSKWPFIIIK